MPRNPATLTVLQDKIDELSEALTRKDPDHLARLVPELQTHLAEQDLRTRAARSLERNGWSDYTMKLFRQLGVEIRRTA